MIPFDITKHFREGKKETLFYTEMTLFTERCYKSVYVCVLI